MTSWVTVNPDILNGTDNSTIVATAVREFITPRDCSYNAQWKWIWGGFEKKGDELFGGEMWEIKWSQEHEGCLCVNMNIWKELVDGTEFRQGGGLLMHSFCGLSFPIRPECSTAWGSFRQSCGTEEQLRRPNKQRDYWTPTKSML